MGRTPPPSEPWCLITAALFGVRRVLKVPERYVAENKLVEHGWSVLIRDSDMTPAAPEMRTLQSNPRRVTDPNDLGD